ncbi:MAG: YdiU family protein [Pseudomonadota bacterium]|nr:YdiU family protein [Pseudomonadota bacterium]
MTNPAPIPFDNSYARLPPRFHAREHPTPVPAPALIRVNGPLAAQLGIDAHWLASPEALAAFAGNQLPPGAEPLAGVYAGHQFGGWNPQLGDGRAILLGEVVDGEGRRFDIQLKGAGPTPWSRGGDGRSPLGPVLREYIVSEAMAALGIPTTRSLAAVTTGAPVYRDRALPGAILTRVARSHIRVGHFQYFLAREDNEALRLLADHVIARDFPEARGADNPYLALLDQAVARQATLIAQWQLVGFIHGVMNTDNMLVCGETIDYGPCAFMEGYDPNACFSAIDQGRRYAYKNQPLIAQWNLSWLAQSLLPVMIEAEGPGANAEAVVARAQGILDDFPRRYETAYSLGLHRKLGLAVPDDGTARLADALLARMATDQLDFTLTFRRLADLADPDGAAAPPVDYPLPPSLDALIEELRALHRAQGFSPAQVQRAMHAANPAYIPRNHRVEQAIRAAEDDGDFAPFQRLVERLARPFEVDPADADLTLPPAPHQVVTRTFCGT